MSTASEGTAPLAGGRGAARRPAGSGARLPARQAGPARAASGRAPGIAGLALVLTVLPASPGSAADTENLAAAQAGEYIYRAAGCEGCHTDQENEGPVLAGGRRFDTPFGVFYSPNITADPLHGIGGWTEEDMVRALSRGLAPDGSHYYPVFPYTAYTRMHEADMRALWAYLRTVPPVARANRPPELPWYLRFRIANWAWKQLNFEAGPMPPDPDRSAEWNRGAYLAEALGHCGECHTPRNSSGGLVREMHYAGTRAGADGELVPNITPDRETGIGRWSKGDLIYFLETGATPDGDFTGGAMAEVIRRGLKYLTRADREALATYLRELPAIEHRLRERQADTRPRGEFD